MPRTPAANRRRGPAVARRRTRRRWWLLVAASIGLVAVGMLAWRVTARSERTTAEASVGCSSMEQLSYHVHAHLALYVDGVPRAVPGGIGLRRDCISWLHTHDATGILHIEAPAPHPYTLGQFFSVWGQPLDATHLLDQAAEDQHQLRAYVNGQLYQGAPETIPLAAHVDIVLEYGPPFVPPPPFSFPPGS